VATSSTLPGGAVVPADPGGTPASVGADLARLESAIRDPATTAAQLPGLGRAQQTAYRQLLAHPDWVPAAVAAVPPRLRSAVEANVRAGSELALLAPPRPRLPPWRIVTPAPADRLVADYRAAAAETGVPWPFLAAIHLVETRLSRIRGTSTAGAQGPMQFLPATWAQYGNGGDINDDRDAIFAAARLLRRNGAPASMGTALFNYNRSQHYVNGVTAYASVIQGDERAFLGYHEWQVYYRLTTGDVLLPEGFTG
jgi:hypothetical protein